MVINKLRSTAAFAVIILCLLFSSCTNTQSANETPPSGNSPADAQSEIPTETTAQSDMWLVELTSAELADNLTATQSAVQYGGQILENTSEFKPTAGNIFLLLELSIEKTGTGKAFFSWSDAHILDKDGNKYYRHPNDTFLTNLNIPRLKGTDIVFGKEHGFACFEIPKDSSGLQFIADNTNIKIKVTV